MATTASFSEHLAPGLRDIVGTNLGGREAHYSSLMRVETSERNYEDFLAAAGLPVATIKGEGQPIAAFDPLEGGTMRLNHTVYGIGMEVSEEAWEDDLYQGKGSALRDAGSSLADSLAEVTEIQAHRMYNAEAFLTSAVPSFLRTLPDNASTISVYSKTHGTVSGGEAGTQSNRPSTDVDLTVTSFRTGLTQFKKWRDDRNKRIPGYTTPRMMVVPTELEWDAKEILGSLNRPDTANRVENVTKGAVSLHISPYIDDSDSWFLIGGKHYLVFLWRWRPRMDNFDDRRSRIAVFLAYQRFALGAIDWRGVYGSPGG